MYLILQFLEGPLRGKAVTLRRSVSLGRKGTDIELNDSKVSQIHAFIQFNDRNQWVLTDNSSRNGVRSQGKKVQSLVLAEGTRFALGKSLVQCTFEGRNLAAPESLVDSSFIQWLKSGAESLPNNINVIEKLVPAINLHFTEGQQLGTVWELIYAPRKAGFSNLDLCLYEDGLPKEAFVIDAVDGHPYLKTNRSDIVRVNGEPTKKKRLVHGDVIQVGAAKIQVEMVL